MYSSRTSGGSVTEEELVSGFLKKQGPPSRPNWKKRWFVLTTTGSERKILYFKKKPEDEKKREKYLKGTVPLDKTSVLVLSASTQKKFEHSFAIKTPDRNFVFLAADAQDKEKWTSVILKVMAAIRDEVKKGPASAPQAPKSLPKPGEKGGIKATEPPPHLETLVDIVEEDSPPPVRPKSSVSGPSVTDVTSGGSATGGSKIITINPSPSPSSTPSAGGSKIVPPQPSAFAHQAPAFGNGGSGGTSPAVRDRSERERGGGGGSIFRKGGEGDISDKPLLRTAESVGSRTSLVDRPHGDRSSAYNVVGGGLNLIPDYSENATDSEGEGDDVDYIHKRGAKSSGWASWIPSWCPCASFQTL